MTEEDVYNETLRLTLQRDLDAFTKAGMTEEAGKVKARLDGVPETAAEVRSRGRSRGATEDTGTGRVRGPDAAPAREPRSKERASRERRR